MAEKKELTFEENLSKLESIVKNLENGETPLDEAINQFTEAMQLVEVCDKKLKNAEEKITKIVTKDGKLEDFSVEE